MNKKKHTNWSQNIKFSASEIKYPSSIHELQHLIKTHPKVHIGGTFHCFNNIADTTGILICLKKMNKISLKCPKTVYIEAGITYSDLRARLMKTNRAIVNFPSLPHLNIIGSIVTGTHGGAKDMRIMADLVHEYTIMDGLGKIRVLTRSDPLFFKLLVGLGYLGVIVSVRLYTVESFTIQKSIYSNVDFRKFKELGTDIFDLCEYTSLFFDLDKNYISSVWFGKKVPPDSQESTC